MPATLKELMRECDVPDMHPKKDWREFREWRSLNPTIEDRMERVFLRRGWFRDDNLYVVRTFRLKPSNYLKLRKELIAIHHRQMTPGMTIDPHYANVRIVCPQLGRN